MFPRATLCLCLLALGLAGRLPAQSPAILNYQGRVSVDDKNFNGTAYFVFSIQDTNGVILWSSGNFPTRGTTNLPPGVWRLNVRDGLYHIRLGDRSAGMPLLDAGLLRNASAPQLRVWFNDGLKGWLPLAGDAPLHSAFHPAAATAATSATATGTLTAAQGDTILRELREVRGMLQKQPGPTAPAPETPKTVTVPLGDSPSLGRADAPLVLVEFTEYQCPYCKRAHDGVLVELQKKFIETGKLRLVSRNLPLPFHPNAEPAAHAAMCAHAQQQFWPMRDRLFVNTAALSQADFLKAAEELKLDLKAFEACLAAKPYAAQIARDKQDAAAAGITGTPTFVLGRAQAGKVTGLLIVGAKPLPFFEAEIEKLLPAK
jgi:protein-disulfide isomerase